MLASSFIGRKIARGIDSKNFRKVVPVAIILVSIKFNLDGLQV